MISHSLNILLGLNLSSSSFVDMGGNFFDVSVSLELSSSDALCSSSYSVEVLLGLAGSLDLVCKEVDVVLVLDGLVPDLADSLTYGSDVFLGLELSSSGGVNLVC